MKKRKIPFLLATILCAALLLIGCGDNGGSGEFSDYFGPYEFDDGIPTEAVEIEGELLDVDYDNNLVATRTEDFNALGERIVTLRVIDIVTDKIVYEYEATSSYTTKANASYEEYSAEIEYPLAVVERTHYYYNESTQDYESSSYYTYTVLNKENYCLYSDTSVDDVDIDFGVNVYVCRIGTYTTILDGNLEVIADNSAHSALIDLNDIELEYYMNGLFYSVDDYSVTVYNKDLVPVANYAPLTNDGATITASVLANGNVLIQSLTEADEDDYDVECTDGNLDYRYSYLESYILNAKTGALKEIELDYLAEIIFPAFYLDSTGEFFFEIKDNTPNIGSVFKIADKKISEDDATFAAIGNDGKILAALPKFQDNSVSAQVYPLMPDRYLAYAEVGNEYYYYLLDESFNVIAPVCSEIYGSFEYTKDYILVNNVLYNKNMKVVEDFNDGAWADVYISGNNVYLVPSYAPAVTFRYNPKTGEKIVVQDGIGKSLFTPEKYSGDFGDSVPDFCYITITGSDSAYYAELYSDNHKLLLTFTDPDDYYYLESTRDAQIISIGGTYYVLR